MMNLNSIPASNNAQNLFQIFNLPKSGGASYLFSDIIKIVGDETELNTADNLTLLNSAGTAQLSAGANLIDSSKLLNILFKSAKTESTGTSEAPAEGENIFISEQELKGFLDKLGAAPLIPEGIASSEVEIELTPELIDKLSKLVESSGSKKLKEMFISLDTSSTGGQMSKTAKPGDITNPDGNKKIKLVFKKVEEDPNLIYPLFQFAAVDTATKTASTGELILSAEMQETEDDNAVITLLADGTKGNKPSGKAVLPSTGAASQGNPAGEPVLDFPEEKINFMSAALDNSEIPVDNSDVNVTGPGNAEKVQPEKTAIFSDTLISEESINKPIEKDRAVYTSSPKTDTSKGIQTNIEVNDNSGLHISEDPDVKPAYHKITDETAVKNNTGITGEIKSAYTEINKNTLPVTDRINQKSIPDSPEVIKNKINEPDNDNIFPKTDVTPSKETIISDTDNQLKTAEGKSSVINKFKPLQDGEGNLYKVTVEKPETAPAVYEEKVLPQDFNTIDYDEFTSRVFFNKPKAFSPDNLKEKAAAAEQAEKLNSEKPVHLKSSTAVINQQEAQAVPKSEVQNFPETQPAVKPEAEEGRKSTIEEKNSLTSGHNSKSAEETSLHSNDASAHDQQGSVAGSGSDNASTPDRLTQKQSFETAFAESVNPRGSHVPEKAEVPVKEYTSVFKNINASDLIDEVKNLFVKGDKSNVTLKLSPEHLGTVKLIIDLKNQVLDTKIEVENEAVRQVVQNNMDSLKQSLQQSGIQLNSYSISLTSDEQKSPGRPFGRKKSSSGGSTDIKIDKEVKAQDTKKMGYNTYEYLA